MGLVIAFFNTKLALQLNESKEVYDLVEKVKNNTVNSTTVLLGDSVCRQFFGSKKSDDVYCLCENQSYEVVGNYLLLLNLIENKSAFKNLILVINPRTLVSSLNQPYTYNYFVKPFESELDRLEFNELIYIENTFPSEDVLKYKFSNFELKDAFDIMNDTMSTPYKISEVNLKYLKKIDSVCKSEQIKYKMVSPPLPASNKGFMANMKQNNPENLLTDYFSSVVFYDDKESKDGLHHKEPEKYIADNKEELDTLVSFHR
ncbi:hypothetical protein [Zobellia russellii]|uniref:hypothetical protein n=1 Tax=Zobellia russellii TaxID=248907 RepID=UPI001BFF339B|nr:hypothetical protein [Zobellia russellii]MBT9186733.1 hypothetical protein [Zobellia russellii]